MNTACLRWFSATPAVAMGESFSKLLVASLFHDCLHFILLRYRIGAATLQSKGAANAVTSNGRSAGSASCKGVPIRKTPGPSGTSRHLISGCLRCGHLEDALIHRRRHLIDIDRRGQVEPPE